jgi:hypothetical protein
MHMLTIAFGGMGMAWKFGFKTAEAAEAAYTAAHNSIGHPNNAINPPVEIKDDFGQRGKFGAGITGALLEDLDEVKLLHIEHALHEAKTRAAVQNRAQNDPTLKFMQQNGPGGPATLSPMMR